MSLSQRLFPLYEPKVQLELYKLANQNLKVGLYAPAGVALILIAGFGATLPRGALIIWLVLMTGMTLSSFLMRRRFRQLTADAAPDPATLLRFHRAMLRHFALVGIAWGAVMLLTVPELQLQNAIMLVVFLSVMAVGSSNLGVHSLHGYLLGIACGGLFAFPLLPGAFGSYALPLAGAVAFFYLVLINVARSAHRTLVQSVRLQFLNDELLAQKAAEAERAERANREKSLFLAAASHDLRQPVHALLLLIEALRQRAGDGALHELVEYVRQAGETIGKLFAALMELSRLESGSEKAERADIHLAEVMRAALARHRPEAERRGLRLTLRLGRGTGDLWAHTDRVLLERILDNLVENALRYTQRGGVLLSARHRADGRVWIEVWDTGIGIAPHELERIFEPYYQAANPERDRRKGLGLGMAIVRRTAELLGMTITVQSRPGRGSCFRLALDVLDTRPLALATATVHEETAPQLAGRRVLVVDDDPMVLRAMDVVLGTWQVDYRCVSDYDAAVQLATGGSWIPEALLCDYRLPGAHNGIELLDTLTEYWPGAAAILLTGELSPQVRDQAEDAGYLVITKPVQGDTLATTLETVLR